MLTAPCALPIVPQSFVPLKGLDRDCGLTFQLPIAMKISKSTIFVVRFTWGVTDAFTNRPRGFYFPIHSPIEIDRLLRDGYQSLREG